MKLTLLPLASLLIMTGCATTLSTNAMKVQDADATIVGRCNLIGDVQGSSGWGNLAASAGMGRHKGT